MEVAGRGRKRQLGELSQLLIPREQGCVWEAGMKKGFHIAWGSFCYNSCTGRVRTSLSPLLLSKNIFRNSLAVPLSVPC